MTHSLCVVLTIVGRLTFGSIRWESRNQNSSYFSIRISLNCTLGLHTYHWQADRPKELQPNSILWIWFFGQAIVTSKWKVTNILKASFRVRSLRLESQQRRIWSATFGRENRTGQNFWLRSGDRRRSAWSATVINVTNWRSYDGRFWFGNRFLSRTKRLAFETRTQNFGDKTTSGQTETLTANWQTVG